MNKILIFIGLMIANVSFGQTYQYVGSLGDIILIKQSNRSQLIFARVGDNLDSKTVLIKVDTSTSKITVTINGDQRLTTFNPDIKSLPRPKQTQPEQLSDVLFEANSEKKDNNEQISEAN